MLHSHLNLNIGIDVPTILKRSKLQGASVLHLCSPSISSIVEGRYYTLQLYVKK